MIEKDIVYFLNHLGSDYIDSISILISNYVFMIFIFTIVIFIFLYFDEKRFKNLLIAIIFGLLLHFFITEMFIKVFLSNFFIRTRPYAAFPDIIALGQRFSDSSFPSSHMSIISTFTTILVLIYRRTKIHSKILLFSVISLLLMAFSRMHNGMHYPSDIIAGTVLGIAYGMIAVFLAEKIKRKKNRKKRI